MEDNYNRKRRIKGGRDTSAVSLAAERSALSASPPLTQLGCLSIARIWPVCLFSTDAGWGRVATGLHCTSHSQASVLGWSSLPRPTGG